MSEFEKAVNKNAFYVYHYPKDRKKESRKECQGKSCSIYNDAGYSMHCGHFFAGWCNHDKYGVVSDDLLVTVDVVLAEHKKAIEEKLHRLKSKRAGSVFTESEELAQEWILKQLLNEDMPNIEKDLASLRQPILEAIKERAEQKKKLKQLIPIFKEELDKIINATTARNMFFRDEPEKALKIALKKFEEFLKHE